MGVELRLQRKLDIWGCNITPGQEQQNETFSVYQGVFSRVFVILSLKFSIENCL